jgi:hypothetical protein
MSVVLGRLYTIMDYASHGPVDQYMCVDEGYGQRLSVFVNKSSRMVYISDATRWFTADYTPQPSDTFEIKEYGSSCMEEYGEASTMRIINKRNCDEEYYVYFLKEYPDVEPPEGTNTRALLFEKA